MEQKVFSEKEYYRQKIIEMVGKVESTAILNYIYIIVADVVKEDKKNSEKN